MRRSVGCFALALAAVTGCAKHEKTVRLENPPLTIAPPSAAPPSPSPSSPPSASPPPARDH